MMDVAPQGYRTPQVLLHWFVALAALWLFFTGDATTQAYRAGEGLISFWIWSHALLGTLILVAMLWRLQLRWSVGAPPPPAEEWAPLRILAQLVHAGLYIDMIGAALLGLAAYFVSTSFGDAHEFSARAPLVGLFALHAAGALWHHFGLRDDVLKRMLRPVKP